MNFLTVEKYIDAGDQVEIVLDDANSSMYSGILIEVTNEEIVIGYNRHTDWDADKSEIEQATLIIDKEHIVNVKKVAKHAKTY